MVDLSIAFCMLTRPGRCVASFFVSNFASRKLLKIRTSKKKQKRSVLRDKWVERRGQQHFLHPSAGMESMAWDNFRAEKNENNHIMYNKISWGYNNHGIHWMIFHIQWGYNDNLIWIIWIIWIICNTMGILSYYIIFIGDISWLTIYKQLHNNSPVGDILSPVAGVCLLPAIYGWMHHYLSAGVSLCRLRGVACNDLVVGDREKWG